MTAVLDTDVVVLGGGCAGLSLAAALARLDDGGPRVDVVERRASYADDRTWCFWAGDTHASSDLVSRRWSAWRFSGGGEAHVHWSSTDLSYQCVAAGDFHKAMLADIETSARVSLWTDTGVGDVHDDGDSVTVTTDDGPVRARWVVDTRPSAAGAGGYAQRFAGVEIETDEDRFDPAVVGLMEDMTVDDAGFRFTYLLPFGPRRALVEETRFGRPVSPSRLHRQLDQTIGRLAQGATHRVLRREAGTIPMAVRDAPTSASPRVVAAGTAGGAVRPSTGYAFTRIQHWAERCARELHRGRPPVPHPPDPAWRRKADALFLRVLDRWPELAPDVFLAMGAGVAPATLVRFLGDEGGRLDLLRVAGALPKRPFLTELASSARARP